MTRRLSGPANESHAVAVKVNVERRVLEHFQLSNKQFLIHRLPRNTLYNSLTVHIGIDVASHLNLRQHQAPLKLVS